MEEKADAEEGDAAFLAEVLGFLGDCDHQAQVPTTGGDSLLLENHLLHTETETEALFSSFSAPSAPSASVQEPGASSCNAAPAVTTKPPIIAREASGESPLSDKAERRRAVWNAQAAKRRARYRQQLKAEWQLLRQQESELSMELSDLQKAQAQSKVLRRSSLALPAWRVITALQREKRREAETQHEGLRATVASQAMVIQQMKGLLQQMLAVAAPEHFISREKHTVGLESHEIALFEAFVRELEPLYAQTDEVTHPHGMKIEPTTFMTYKPICKRQKDTMYYESVDAMCLPFDFQRACRAASKLLLSVPEGCQRFDGVNDLENKVAVKYLTKHRLDSGETALMVTYCVTKMYWEAERLVFVWRGLTEGQGAFAGMHSNETGWLVVRPSTVKECKPSVKQGGAGAPTVLENCVRFVPMHFGGASNCDVAADRFAEIIAKTGEKELGEVTQMLAKLLVDAGGAIPAEMAR
ncbi:hypothetical protein BBJ28_00003392 [Nothophytophthora sp. Chile5]|nr:hypothetical protein BBJ28_00003392 [Nothophytophthora sp. Chile5]